MKLAKYLLVPSIAILAACGGEKTVYIYQDTIPEEATTNAPKTTPAPVTQAPYVPNVPSYSDEDGFLNGIYEETLLPFYPYYMTDSEILDLGYMICSQFRLGASLDDVIAQILSVNGTYQFNSDMSATVGIAVAWLCEDQMSVFRGME